MAQVKHLRANHGSGVDALLGAAAERRAMKGDPYQAEQYLQDRHGKHQPRQRQMKQEGGQPQRQPPPQQQQRRRYKPQPSQQSSQGDKGGPRCPKGKERKGGRQNGACKGNVGAPSARGKTSVRLGKRGRKPGPRPSKCPWCDVAGCSHCHCQGFEGCSHLPGEMCQRPRYKRRLVCNPCEKHKLKFSKRMKNASARGQVAGCGSRARSGSGAAVRRGSGMVGGGARAANQRAVTQGQPYPNSHMMRVAAQQPQPRGTLVVSGPGTGRLGRGKREDAVWEMFTTLACWNFGAKKGTQSYAGEPPPYPGAGLGLASAVGTLTAVPTAPSGYHPGPAGVLAGSPRGQHVLSAVGGGPAAPHASAATSLMAGSGDPMGARQVAMFGSLHATGTVASLGQRSDCLSAPVDGAPCGMKAAEIRPRSNSDGNSSGGGSGSDNSGNHSSNSSGSNGSNSSTTVQQFTSMAQWLQSAGLAEFISVFEHEGMDNDALFVLQRQLPDIDDELRDIFKMRRLGDRLKFKSALKNLVMLQPRADQLS